MHTAILAVRVPVGPASAGPAECDIRTHPAVASRRGRSARHRDGTVPAARVRPHPGSPR
ncbi:hypothetical protein SAZ_07085 [Streptomyces noursei ZPM]|nr:hypothetical protein SAZ_07085 [Streptomyces noursei ZPM]EPY93725.1 hypothetical protein K530_46710 [Streptomyces noursei CCRC 11814]